MRKIIVLVAATALLAPAAATAAGGKNIVQTASGAGQFTTLVSLVKKAGLASALSGKGQLTVFAPTDAAFAKVPKATLDALAADRAKLRAVLLYHVVRGKVAAAQAMKLRSAKSLQGAALRVRTTGSTVRINNARVVTADVMASNGVIHVVDRVLLPPSM
jgi:uncharacterized surface protein with fasciclin (FAS1) repeats